MREALAIGREEKRRCLFGQYRFTEWTMPEPRERGKGVLATVSPKGIQVVDGNARNGTVPASSKFHRIPREILSWFEHFEKKGIKAAIVKKCDSEKYAILRHGEEHSAGIEEPEFITKSDVIILKRCHGFTMNIQEY